MQDYLCYSDLNLFPQLDEFLPDRWLTGTNDMKLC